jgi:uncharacterized protein YqiB (DUF1249 family)
MFVDSDIVPECIASPGSFGGLMALYEANFIKLTGLVADLRHCPAEQVSRVSDDCDLYLVVESRSRYTCELRLTYRFEEPDGSVDDPDLVARVYFDARMAEVTGWINSHRHELLRRLSRECGRELGHCWRRNIMFSKWLDYLHDQGHGFDPVAAPASIDLPTP